MRSAQFLCLDPAVRVPEISSFNLLTQMCNGIMTYHLVAMQGLASVFEQEEKADILGIILLGSSANVSENLPWQKPLMEWLHKKIEQDIPLFAICYGHQLISHMFGAPVGKNSDQIKYSGVRKYTRVKQVSSFMPLADELNVAVSHYEQVKAIPKGFELILTAPNTPFAGFTHPEKPVFTLQAHPESTPLFCEGLGISTPPGFTNDAGLGLLRDFFVFCKNRYAK